MKYMWLVKSQNYFIKAKVHSTYTNIVQFSYLTQEFKNAPHYGKDQNIQPLKDVICAEDQ